MASEDTRKRVWSVVTAALSGLSFGVLRGFGQFLWEQIDW